jgi:ribosomal protein L11 methyltransferase
MLVYECYGTNPPCGEPHDSGFLGIWPEPPFYYLFFADDPGESLSRWLGNQQGWVMRNTYRLTYDEWQQVAVRHVQVGPFLIEMVPAVTSHLKTAEAKGIVIRIDPGLVFGSGLHGSTRGCLLAVADLFNQSPAEKVVDMGAGTGILAISCGLLGAARVLAIDKNPLAIRAAAGNVFLNQMQDRVELLVAEDLGVLRGSFDLLMMNLEVPILQQQLAGYHWLAYPWVILSGFLESQWDKLKDYIAPSYHIRGRKTVDDWLTVTIARRGLP